MGEKNQLSMKILEDALIDIKMQMCEMTQHWEKSIENWKRSEANLAQFIHNERYVNNYDAKMKKMESEMRRVMHGLAERMDEWENLTCFAKLKRFICRVLHIRQK